MGHTSCKDDLMAYALYILILFGLHVKPANPLKMREINTTYCTINVLLLDSLCSVFIIIRARIVSSVPWAVQGTLTRYISKLLYRTGVTVGYLCFNGKESELTNFNTPRSELLCNFNCSLVVYFLLKNTQKSASFLSVVKKTVPRTCILSSCAGFMTHLRLNS